MEKIKGMEANTASQISLLQEQAKGTYSALVQIVSICYRLGITLDGLDVEEETYWAPLRVTIEHSAGRYQYHPAFGLKRAAGTGQPLGRCDQHIPTLLAAQAAAELWIADAASVLLPLVLESEKTAKETVAKRNRLIDALRGKD